MRVCEEGLALIRYFEGFRGSAYLCPGGVWTIGYGITAGVREGDTITREEAEARLLEEVYERAAQVVRSLERIPPSHQLSACVSLQFNIGQGAWVSSWVRRLHEEGRPAEAADAFRNWIRSGGRVLDGLILRREAERELYLHGTWTRPYTRDVVEIEHIVERRRLSDPMAEDRNG